MKNIRLLLDPSATEGGGAGTPNQAGPTLIQRARAMMLGGDYNALQAQLGQAQGRITALETENATFRARVAELEPLAAQVAELEQAVAAAETARQQAIQSVGQQAARQAAAIVARAGIPSGQVPASEEGITGTEEKKVMTRAAFNELTASQRAQFCREGGKLKD